MKVFFRTKEESNRVQEEEFLKLAPQERFYSFLALMNKLKTFKPSSGSKNNNFKIIINDQ